MDDDRFARIANQGRDTLTALLGPFNGALPGEGICYNAYLGDIEVVVLGYRYRDDKGQVTKPVAIVVDEELFRHMRVDGEVGRVLGGEEQPPMLREDPCPCGRPFPHVKAKASGCFS